MPASYITSSSTVRRWPGIVMAILATGCWRGAIHFADSEVVSTATSVGTSPMLAFSPTGLMATAWLSAPDGGKDSRLYISVAGGAAAELRDSLGPVEVRPEAPPKLSFGPEGTLDAVYVVAKEVPGFREPRGVMRFVQSKDRGRTWSAPVNVANDDQFGAYDFHALHVAADGTIYVSWIGGEEEKAAAWITHSTDQGATWSPRARVDIGEACPCCRTALGTGPDGTLYMAWRHVFDGNVRDIVVARSNDKGESWTEPVRVHADGWVFNGCPRAGPALQVDKFGRVHVAWWTGKEKAAGVWYARSEDGGRSFGSPYPVDVASSASPSHVQLGLGADGAVVAAWDDGISAERRILVRLSRDGGNHFEPKQALSSGGRSPGYPVLALSGRDVTVAWSEVSQAAADSAARMAAAMKTHDPKAPMKLRAIGGAQVLVRRGTL